MSPRYPELSFACESLSDSDQVTVFNFQQQAVIVINWGVKWTFSAMQEIQPEMFQFELSELSNRV